MKGQHRGSISRFASAPIEVSRSHGLRPDHPAITKGTTLFPSQVSTTWESPRFLVSGHNNPKLGKQVLKGPRSGWPIYHVTLEERATCPRSCPVWSDCYGNAMPYARRHRPDADFIAALKAEVVTLSRAHRDGLLIRLHALGDFYSLAYVQMWARLLAFLPQLAVFGYTARTEDADDEESRAIARAIRELTETQWDRFSIRFSRAEAGPQRSIVVDADPGQSDVIICPAQTEATTACATCGLCWAPAAREKTIAFLRHGMKRRSPSPALDHAEALSPANGNIASRPVCRRSKSTMGRPLRGALPGETREQRARRIAAFGAEHSTLLPEQIAARLNVPMQAVRLALAAGGAGSIRNTSVTRLPPQQFTPGPKPLPTPEERLAAVPEAERLRIAKAYGALFRANPKEVA